MPQDTLPLINTEGFVLFGALEKSWYENNYTEILTDLESKEQCEILSIQKVPLPDFDSNEINSNNSISFARKFNKSNYSSSTYAASSIKAIETIELIKKINKNDSVAAQYILTLVRKL
jgi:hypothetical protein